MTYIHMIDYSKTLEWGIKRYLLACKKKYISLSLTRGSMVEFNRDNAMELNLLKEIFVIYCGPTRLKRLIYTVIQRDFQFTKNFIN